jgi:hypothetical protein
MGKGQIQIVGSKEDSDTLEFFKAELHYISNNLSNELETNYENRRKLVRTIFDKKQEVIAVYKDARDGLMAL